MYGDRDGQSRNVGVFRFDKHAKGGNVAAEAFRADAQSVNFFKHFLFKGRKIFVGVVFVLVAQKGVLAHNRRLFHRAADADAQNYGRTRATACVFHRFHNLFDHALDAVRRS